jgi:hypothetical protein
MTMRAPRFSGNTPESRGLHMVMVFVFLASAWAGGTVDSGAFTSGAATGVAGTVVAAAGRFNILAILAAT